MKKLTGYFIKHRILLALYTFFAFINIQNIVSQSLVVDGIDLMEGFTFGAAAEDINTAGYNVWTVTNTDDQVFDVVPGSLRWAIEQINKDDYKAQDNYIHFDIPGSGPFEIRLTEDLPVINGNVIIDGELSSKGEPEIIINGVNDCKFLLYINNYETNAFFNLQKITLKNGIYNLSISNCKKVKIHSNIINTKQGIKPANPTSAYWYISLMCSVYDLSIKGNILGTDIYFDTIYSHELSYAIITSGTKYTFGGNQLNDRNVFANCRVGTSHSIINSINNLYFNLDRGLRNVRRNTSFSKNLFYKCNDAIENFRSNNNAYRPEITSFILADDNFLIKGTTHTNRPGETIEVFLGTSESTEDAIKYLGNAVSDANGEWELSGNSSDWADPSFTLREGDIILAASTYDGQTSDFSDTAMISCTPANLIITDPATACETDLTDPNIIKGSTGGESILIDQAGFVTEDNTNTGDVYTDMSWWDDEGQPKAMIDNDETTYWHAQPRTGKTNFFIINMQQLYDISKVEILVGDNAFTDGVCEVYVADWEDQTEGYEISNLNWTKVTEFALPDPNTTQTIEFNGEIGQFIKFQLTTTVDKDYFDIKEIRMYRHKFTYFEDADATILLDDPEHITTSGTYYIKLGQGSCTDVQPVQVDIDPSLCPACPVDLVVHDPGPACMVDLTDLSVTAGSTGGEKEQIASEGLITEDHSNTGNDYTDMGWWDDQDHPGAIVDGDESTFWHARARTTQTNYFIINMQDIHEVSKIEIVSGAGVFDEGLCEIHVADWADNPENYELENLAWEKITEFGPVATNSTKSIYLDGDSAQFIKFKLTTDIDKDYWDIKEIRVFHNVCQYFEDQAATIPVSNPGNITASGTYYIQLGEGDCTDIQPVEVVIDENLCSLPPELVVHDPEPVTFTDLTDPALKEGTKGNGNGIIDKNSFVCNNNLSDMDWWDDADGQESMIDDSPGSYFHAQARYNNTNYFIIDMQDVYPVGEMDITSGWNVFDEGTCSVYLSEDKEHWVKGAEFGPVFINSTKNIPIYGIPARYVKFELSTDIDKDYWDIHNIEVYEHEYSYWKNDEQTDPVVRPDSVTEPGIYHIGLKAGNLKTGKSVELKSTSCLEITRQMDAVNISCGNDVHLFIAATCAEEYEWRAIEENVGSVLLGKTTNNVFIVQDAFDHYYESYYCIVHGSDGSTVRSDNYTFELAGGGYHLYLNMAVTPSEICKGGTAVITLEDDLIGIAPTASIIYFSPNTGVINSNLTQRTVRLSESQSYHAVAKKRDCYKEFDLSVEVIPTPDILITPSDEPLHAIKGVPLDITASGYNSYTWNDHGSNTLTPSTGPVVTFLSNNPDEFDITITADDNRNCHQTKNFKVIVLEEFFVELHKKTDGGYHLVKTDALLFRYNEKYFTGDNTKLSYNVYNSTGNTVSMPLDNDQVKYGNNYYVARTNGLAEGFYILEVTGAKGDKWYLRFKIKR